MTLGNLSDETFSVMAGLLIRDNGLDRLAAQSGCMRERYVHADHWVGAIEKIGMVQLHRHSGGDCRNPEAREGNAGSAYNTLHSWLAHQWKRYWPGHVRYLDLYHAPKAEFQKLLNQAIRV